MNNKNQGEPNPSPSAEAVFSEWAARVEDGEDVDFATVLAAWPSLVDELKVLHEDWQAFGPLLGKVVPGQLSADANLHVDPLLPDDDEGDGDAYSQGMLDRYGIKAPLTGRYRFRSVLGRGGGGIVLKVWDSKLHRPLAMKVVLGRGEARPTGDTPKVDGRTLSRFVDEARIASQLNHPGIVPVHDLGTDETGRAYFTMKLVRGEDLSKIFEHVKSGHDDWNQTGALNVMLRVCEAMAVAHGKRVVHRDLKPANVMVGKYGEVHVMDWGLARVLDQPDHRDLRVAPPKHDPASVVDSIRADERRDTPHSPLQTMDGHALGTPAYMPPEQALGKVEAIDARSDVYSLGAMLYELLAGHPPYLDDPIDLSPSDLVLRVVAGPPTPLEKAAPSVAPELVSICNRCMARDSARRYQDTSELAADLRAFLENRVVKAHRVGAWVEFRKWYGRNRLAGTALFSIAGVLVGGSLIVTLIVQSAQERELAISDPIMATGLLAEASTLLPVSESVAPRMQRWIEDSEGLLRRSKMRAEYLADMEARGTNIPAVEALRRLREEDEQSIRQMIPKMRDRAELASTLKERSVGSVEARRRWAEATDYISASARYAHVRLEPVEGLLPIGVDPISGLCEFAVLGSGEEPTWINAAHGRRLANPEDAAIILVLLPGNTIRLGSLPIDIGNRDGLHWAEVFSRAALLKNRPELADPGNRSNETRTEPISIAPFFISKYELTRGQWVRATGQDPSQNGPAAPDETHRNLALPVESISWVHARETATRLGLTLPTEAQWEYACRAGTTSPFCSGWTAADVSHVANIADASYAEWAKSKGRTVGDETATVETRDPFVSVAPIGSLQPNDFGLYDMHGNVWEWCLDPFADAFRPRNGDGLNTAQGNELLGSIRGGSYFTPMDSVRSAGRFQGGYGRTNTDSDLGVRLCRPLDP